MGGSQLPPGAGRELWGCFRAGWAPRDPFPRTHVLGTGAGGTRTPEGIEAPPPAPQAPPTARAHPQRHCGGRGFLPYMGMAALAAAALIGGGGGAARQVRGN